MCALSNITGTRMGSL